MKLPVSGALAILAIVGAAGCGSTRTHATSTPAQGAARFDRCNGLGERASYGLPIGDVPRATMLHVAPDKRESFYYGVQVPPNATITRYTIRGFCFTTPESIAAALRLRDGIR